MNRYAVLCGSAPEDYRQRKLAETYDFLTRGTGAVPEEHVVVFPGGVHELMLEQVLDSILSGEDEEGSDVLLYFFTLSEGDACVTLPDAPCEAVRLAGTEIRREVVAYYEALFERAGSRLTVRYEADGELVSEESLGYEAV